MGAASAASRAANDSVVVDASALQVEINTNEDDNRNGENMDGDVEGGSDEVPRNSTDFMDQACCPVPSVVTRRGSKANDDDPIIDVDRPLSGHGVFEGSGSLSSVVSDHLRRLRDEPVALSEIIREYKRRNVHLAISNPNGTVLRTLERADVVTAVGRDWLFTRVVDAVAACERAMNDIEEPAVAPRLANTGRGGSWLRVQAMLEKNGSPDKMRVGRRGGAE
ncbi:hypothetical protein PPROV_000693900 [Pycnococcus provasolii]|uniref:STAS domain-containing protein n=1 Tax=Pycnococcus provasolii TaxID=41880 RepID=A0A830HMT5_9CHLO|nr:hypothetical protein PPROV_000693900 [Pycnococcus provasolii]